MAPETPLPRLAAALDLLALLLAVLSLSAFATGGFRTEFLGLRISVTSWWRLAAALAIVLAVRHAWRPSPSLARRVTVGFASWWHDATTQATWPVVVATRVGVLVIGLLAVHAIGYPQDKAPIRVAAGEMANLPARFDAGWYLSIATDGYRYTPNRPALQQNVVFFPAFPALMGTFSLLLGRQVVWSGALLSMAAFGWAMRYLYRVARDLMDAERAGVAVALVAVYPFAVFFSAPYTEGLFLLTMLGAWWHLRRDERWAAFAWGFLAGLTRPNGCLLAVPLALMAVAPCWRRGGWQPPPGGWLALSDRLVVAAAPGVGMLVYSAYVYDLTGDPFMWIRLQGAWGREHVGALNFLAGEWESIGRLGAYRYVTNDVSTFLNALAGGLVLASVLPVWRRFGVPMAAVLLLNLVPSLASGGWLSVGRATTVLFPVFLWLADVVPVRHRAYWVCGFAVVQGFAATLFFTWRPLF